MGKRRRFQTKTNSTQSTNTPPPLKEPTFNQHIAYKRRTVKGIPVNHMHIDTDYSGDIYTSSVQTSDISFVMDNIVDIAESCFNQPIAQPVVHVYAPDQNTFLIAHTQIVCKSESILKYDIEGTHTYGGFMLTYSPIHSD
jgi:hypothetical protein